MRTIKLTLAYDGTGLVGWQRQPTGVSVQGLLEASLAPFDGTPVPVAGAGRTDAGVHALGQVASFRLEHRVPIDSLVRALNARLPAAVRVLSAAEAPDGFHARFSARTKTYRYRLLAAPVADPLMGRYAWCVSDHLDMAAMIAAFRRVEGRHDFAAFQASGSDVRDTIRTMSLARVAVREMAGSGRAGEAELVEFELTGDGFLRHMVRNVIGTVIEVGRGRRVVESIDELLAGASRAHAGPAAPAQGLCLVRVTY